MSITDITRKNSNLDLFFGPAIPCRDFVNIDRDRSPYIPSEEIDKLCASKKRDNEYFEEALLKLGSGSANFLVSSDSSVIVPFVHRILGQFRLNNGLAEALINFGKKYVFKDLINIGDLYQDCGMTPLIYCIKISRTMSSGTFDYESPINQRVKFLIDKLNANPNISGMFHPETALSLTIQIYHDHKYGNKYFYIGNQQALAIKNYTETMKSLVRRSGIISNRRGFRILGVTEDRLIEILKMVKKEIDSEDLSTATAIMNTSSLCKSTATLVAQYYNDTYEDDNS